MAPVMDIWEDVPIGQVKQVEGRLGERGWVTPQSRGTGAAMEHGRGGGGVLATSLSRCAHTSACADEAGILSGYSYTEVAFFLTAGQGSNFYDL